MRDVQKALKEQIQELDQAKIVNDRYLNIDLTAINRKVIYLRSAMGSGKT
jgi:hypothetical protein